MEINGGAVVAMVGKNCVAIASDKRLGLQAMTVGKEFPKVFPLGPRLYLGLSGMATDIQTLIERLTYNLNIFRLREERDITSKQFAHLVSSTLYGKRFGPYYTEPIVAGLDYDPSTEEWNPFICSMDVIGCINWAADFVVGGTASTSLYGMCECLYEPDLEPEQLFETISQALVNACNRDALSGWGAVVHIITPTQVITRELLTRQD